jgi:hypothetical protein
MPQRQRINLLDRTRRRLAPRMRRLGRPPRVRVDFLFVEDQIVIPSLALRNNQLFFRIEVLIEEVRDQTVDFAVAHSLRFVQRVADCPPDDPLAILLAVGGRPIDLGRIRTIGQVADWLVRINRLVTHAKIFTRREFVSFHRPWLKKPRFRSGRISESRWRSKAPTMPYSPWVMDRTTKVTST